MDTPACCKKAMLAAANSAIAVLNAHNVTWWADFGTLIGATRYGGFIPWDTDMDFGILFDSEEHFKRVWPSIWPKHGSTFMGRYWAANRNLPQDLWYSPHNHNSVDVWPYWLRSNSELKLSTLAGQPVAPDALLMHSHSTGESHLPEWVLPLQPCKFESHVLQCPGQVIPYLQSQFGADSPADILYPVYPRRFSASLIAHRREKDRRDIPLVADALHESGFASLWPLVQAERGEQG